MYKFICFFLFLIPAKLVQAQSIANCKGAFVNYKVYFSNGTHTDYIELYIEKKLIKVATLKKTFMGYVPRTIRGYLWEFKGPEVFLGFFIRDLLSPKVGEFEGFSEIKYKYKRTKYLYDDLYCHIKINHN